MTGTDADDALDLREDQIIDTDEGEQDGEPAPVDNSDDDGEEYDISIDGEDPAAEDGNSTIRNMRAHIAQLTRERDELRRAQPAAPDANDPGPEPDFEADGDKWDWDHAKWKAAWTKWRDDKAQYDQQQGARQEEARREQETWQGQLAEYEKHRAAITAPDRDAAIGAVESKMSQIQRAVIVKMADNPALVKYALGRHPERLEAMAKLTDPFALAKAVAKFEGGIKMTARKRAPEPEQIARGGAPLGGNDAKLEALEKEAAKTGDRSAVVAYKKQMKRGK